MKVIKLTPLFSIDLVVLNQNEEILFGKRVNSPAKNWLFVPGGRVFKNERLQEAFMRISKMELGITVDFSLAEQLGVYEHFYPDSALSDEVSTHYINLTYLITCEKKNIVPPNVQHSFYQWVNVSEVNKKSDIHTHSKLFLPAINDYLAEKRHD